MGSTEARLTLYTASAPNGLKISIALEELRLPYDVVVVDITKLQQKEPWYLAINPNGRIPALVDRSHPEGSLTVFESGAILQYLAHRYDPEHKISFKPGTRDFFECNNWLFFQHGGLGPMQGQAHHFIRYAPVQVEYGVSRYKTETARLYRVLDKRLAQSTSGYLVGDHISIADIATFPFVVWSGYADINLADFPHVKQWETLMYDRPAVKRGCDTPEPLKVKELLNDAEAFKRFTEQGTTWVMQGMQMEGQVYSKTDEPTPAKA